MKKVKRGFTLVELLAVLVILAIILAIAVPSISGVIESSTRKAFESDAKMVLKAIDYKKLESKNFDVLTINKDNIEDLLGLSNVNYDSVNVITKDKSNFITVVGTNKWNDLVACGTYNNMMVVNEISDCSDDAVAPVITILGDNPVSIFIGDTYSDAGATAMDDRDGDITSKIVVTGTINPSIPGAYTITYTVTDITGNQASSSRTVNVIDNVSPTITFNPNGNSTYAKNSATSVNVTDAGDIDDNSLKYVWTTSSDEPTSDSFTNTYTNSQNINTPSNATGGHYLWVEASDIAGNNSIIRSNVFNLDNTKPVITLNGSNPVNINVGSTYSDAGATATDAHSGISGSVVSTGSVNPSVVGTYTITYNVSDNAGNTATAVTRTVNVLDNIAPTVSFGTNGNSTYAKSRSTTVTVSDNISVNTSSLKYLWNTSTTTPSEASFSTTFTNGGTITTPAGVTGSYYLWILAKDNSGNTKIQRTNTFNLDNTKPIITLNGSNLVNINVGSTYSDAGATATDAHSGISGSVVATGTVNTSAVGTYTITYNVSDNAGNAATVVTRTVNVIQTIYTFNYTGGVQTFIAPITGTYKFEVYGAQGYNSTYGGKGGYAVGNKYLIKDQVVTVMVGGQGTASSDGYDGGNGGEATDIRIGGTSINDRIIVAGGGGSKGWSCPLSHQNCGATGSWTVSYGPDGRVYVYGGAGGGTEGGTVGTRTGGSQTSGGVNSYSGYYNGSFGTGGLGYAGGGDGYYGGAGGQHEDMYTSPTGSVSSEDVYSGAGGSGYIGGVTNGSMSSGVQTGNGSAKITYIGS